MSGLPIQGLSIGVSPGSDELPDPRRTGTHGGHHRRADLGASLAGLVLGVVIQGGRRRRLIDWIPSPPRRDRKRRSAVSGSTVAEELRGSLASELASAVDASWTRLQLETTVEPQLCQWENEGGRVRDLALRGTHVPTFARRPR